MVHHNPRGHRPTTGECRTQSVRKTRLAQLCHGESEDPERITPISNVKHWRTVLITILMHILTKHLNPISFFFFIKRGQLSLLVPCSISINSIMKGHIYQNNFHVKMHQITLLPVSLLNICLDVSWLINRIYVSNQFMYVELTVI